MSSKPKKSEYKASEAEKTETKIAAQKAEFFDKNYNPLILNELDDALTEDISNIARSRGNADVMQSLTSGITYASTQNAGEVTSDLAKGFQGQMLQATAGAEGIKNDRVTSAISAAQGQTADNAKAQSALTNIGTSRTLDRAKNKLLIRQANLDAGMKMAGAKMDQKFGKDGKWGKFKDAVDKAEKE